MKVFLRREVIGVASAIGLAVTAMTAPAGLTHAADPPPNDLFANATPITLDFVDTVDTTMATTGEDEDFAAKDACGSPPLDSDAPPDATVWYSLTSAEKLWVQISAEPPWFDIPWFNVVVATPDGFECVGWGANDVVFVAEAGVEYSIQSIDVQTPPFDTVHGGILHFSATSLGAPLPDVCPGIAPNDLSFPPGINLIIGTDGKDVIDGTPGDDLIFGLDGNDLIRGHGGDDILWGCGGDDKVEGGSGSDRIFGDSADYAGDPTNTNGGDDRLFGGTGDDSIRGGPGDDYINAGGGRDDLFGQQGDDDMRAGSGGDFAVGGYGNDIVRGQAGDDEVYGGFDSDTVLGGPGDDFVNGDVVADQVDESDHIDRCFTGSGNDFLPENCERP